MPIVHPGEPSASYLLYKVLLNPNNYRALDCVADPHAAGECGSTSAQNEWCPSAACTATPTECAARVACLNDPEGTCYDVALAPGSSVVPDAEELRRLRNWFGAGDPMPLPFLGDSGLETPALGKAELRMIQAWIIDSKACP
jgi:hypothetical protein